MPMYSSLFIILSLYSFEHGHNWILMAKTIIDI